MNYFKLLWVDPRAGEAEGGEAQSGQAQDGQAGEIL